MRIYVAISYENTSIKDLQHNYAVLNLCLDNKYVMGEKRIITVDDARKINVLKQGYSYETEDKLINYILSDDAPHALLILKNMFINASVTNEYKTSVIVTIRKILQKLNLTEEIFGTDSNLYDSIFSAKTTDELFGKTKKMIILLLNYVSEINKKQKNILYNEIFEYINENYTKDISISEITDKYQISASYLNRILKDIYNISFKTYITERRIQKAKELIHSVPDIKIKDLAETLGYNSATSFIRVFKKYEGMSPGQFIEKVRRDNE